MADGRSAQTTEVFSLEQAELFGTPGEITIKGWTTQAEHVVSVRLYVGGRIIGMTPLKLGLPEAAPSQGRPEAPFYGFVFRGEAPPETRAGEILEAILIGRDGRQLQKATREITQSDRLDALEIVYDSDSRQLRLKGCLFPSRQLHNLSVVFSRGLQHSVRHLFGQRADAVKLDPEKRAVYSGFWDRIPYVAESDVQDVSFRLDFTDGSSRTLPIRPEMIQFNAPEGEIEDISVDWVSDRILVSGWYRSQEPVTGVEVSLAGQRIYGIPVVKPSPRLQKAKGFRGAVAQEFSLSGVLREAVEDPNALFSGEITGELRLISREKELLNSQIPMPAKHEWGQILLAIFDRRSSVLHFDGVLSLPRSPTHAQLLINGRRIDERLPVQTRLADGAGGFSWTYKINGVVPHAGKLGLQFFDAEGGEIGTLLLPADQCLNVSQHGSVDGITEEELAARLAAAYAKISIRPETPSVCWVYQNSAASAEGGGGGLRRMLDLAESFHDAGYTVLLIDRSDPWSLLQWPEEYRRLRRICHYHLMAPSSLRRPLRLRLAEMIEGQTFPQSAEFKPMGKTLAGWLREPMKRQDENPLTARHDQQFNIIAAALVNGLRPRMAISSFTWSSQFHELLDPSILGAIDINDIQSLRAQVFLEAHATFGPEAVPDPTKFAADLNTEIAMLSKAQLLITISRAEQEHLCKHVNMGKVVYAGLSARAETPPPRSAPQSRRVLFVGNLYEPNIDGARLILRDVWPEVLRLIPDATLVFCGKICSALRDVKLPSVKLLGPVENLRAEYQAAALTLNPIRFGTGASVKLVEALALGRCVLSTKVGLRNFEDAAQSGACQQAEIDQFAKAACRLLIDVERRHKMEEAALSYARTRLSPGATHSGLFNLIESKLYY